MGKPDGTAPAWTHRDALTAASASTTTIQAVLRDGGTFNVNGIVEDEFGTDSVDITDDNIVYPGIDMWVSERFGRVLSRGGVEIATVQYSSCGLEGGSWLEVAGRVGLEYEERWDAFDS